ncbi:MAG: cytochrome c3 family protein [Planctomycetes bacterium]|nr:cytochrome c3 family protein [Planctomycetota bacterium]
MKRFTRRGALRWAFMMAAGIVALAAGWAAGRWSATPRRPMLSRPLVQDAGGLKDNSVCLVCHIDLETEEMAAVHLKAGIVCANCHGVSEAHRSDEMNVTPPEVLYGRADIGPFCTACHPTHKTGQQYQEFLRQWSGRRRPNGRMITSDANCMDCHGHHVILPPEQQVPD